MNEATLYSKVFAYATYALSALILAVAVAFTRPYLVMGSALLSLCSVAYMNSSEMINTFIMKKLGVHTKSGLYTYSLSEDSKSLVWKKGSTYRSISVALMKIAKDTEARDIESVIESITVPFEFTVSVEQVNTKEITDELETKRRIKEIELSRIDQKNYQKISAIKRTIDAIEEQIRALKSGSKPLDMQLTIKSAASAGSFGEAAAVSLRQIEAIANAFSTMNLSFEILSGGKLLDAVNYG